MGLLASFNPELTGTQIVDLMTGAADDLGETGKDAVYGYGRINIYRTLVAANGGLEPSAPPTGDKPEEPAPDEQQMLYLPLVNQG